MGAVQPEICTASTPLRGKSDYTSLSTQTKTSVEHTETYHPFIVYFVLLPFVHCPLPLPAWCYNNQTEVGEALAASFRENDISRENVFITTKVWCAEGTVSLGVTSRLVHLCPLCTCFGLAGMFGIADSRVKRTFSTVLSTMKRCSIVCMGHAMGMTLVAKEKSTAVGRTSVRLHD